MKNYLLLLLFTTFSFAQDLKKANKLFENGAYIDAAEIYELLDIKDTSSIKKVGDCYYFNNEMEKAAKWYEKLFTDSNSDEEIQYMYRYAQSLKGIKKYKTADIWMTKYKSLISSNYKPQKTLEYIQSIDENLEIVYDINASKINTELSEFGVSYFGNKVVYASASTLNSSKIFKQNKQPYLDLFIADLTKNGDIKNPVLFSENISSKTHEATPAFTSNGKTIYFSRTNPKKVKVNGKKTANIKLLKAEFVNGEWTNITELPFNSDQYSCGHPTLSNDNTKLYFASDMPGTIGSLDIFVVDILENGYSSPRNLGPKINTENKEVFPYLSDNNTLYFASNGHLGLGGLDIFSSRIKNDILEESINLGSAINSNSDDFAFSIIDSIGQGFISSNRNHPTNDDIYFLKRRKKPKPQYILEGVITDKNTKELLPNSVVTLLNENNEKIIDFIVKENAKYIFEIDYDKKYTVKASQEFYNSSKKNFTIEDKNIINHQMDISLESYIDKEENIVKTPRGDTQIKVNNIYFDFNRWEIKAEAAQELNIVVELLKKYPNMQIEVSSHTDARGSDSYNLALSKKRAKSTLDYIVSQGIDIKRLRSTGYGEKKPLNECIREGICTDMQYNINRRCEFTLLK